VEESNFHIHREDKLKSHFLCGSLRQLVEHMDTEGQTEGQTDRQAGRQADRQTRFSD